jgi:hypothetical protein
MDILSAFTVSLGIGVTQYEDSRPLNYEGGAAAHIKLEHEGSNVNLWTSYYEGNYSALGQRIFSDGYYAFGIGYDFDLTDKLEVSLGVGVGVPRNAKVAQINSSPGYAENIIIGEVAYTLLVANHNVSEDRPIPIPEEERIEYRQTYGSGWSINSSPFLRLGLGYHATKNWRVGAQVNLFNPKTEYWIASSEVATQIVAGTANPEVVGWWKERETWNMNSVEITVSYEF